MIQQGLRLAIGIQTQIERQHLFPRPVEECHLPSAMCAGGVHFSCLLAVCFALRKIRLRSGCQSTRSGTVRVNLPTESVLHHSEQTHTCYGSALPAGIFCPAILSHANPNKSAGPAVCRSPALLFSGIAAVGKSAPVPSFHLARDVNFYFCILLFVSVPYDASKSIEYFPAACYRSCGAYGVYPAVKIVIWRFTPACAWKRQSL